MEFNGEAQRRSGVRVLRPWLRSARMVSLFYRIGLLAASRPGAVATIDLFVERMTSGRTAGADLRAELGELATGRPRRSGGKW